MLFVKDLKGQSVLSVKAQGLGNSSHLSILQQIERLERTQGMESTVDILRKILRNMKRREMEMRLQQ